MEEDRAAAFYGSRENLEIEGKIGRGHFSIVYKVRCNIDDRLLAMKVVSIGEMADANARSQYLREVELLQKLDHPNLVKCYASFIEDNELNIVLELAEAGDLSRMIKHFKKKKCLVPEGTIWKFFVQLCEALEHMHSRRIMHRDVKPANVFVTAEGIVKLGDLGFGRYFSRGGPSNAFTPLGSPYYMSPESMRGVGYDFKSDIWSLGCVLYEMAALQSPFYGEGLDLCLLSKRIEQCDYTPLSSGVYSDALRGLVDACINLVPADRPDITKIVAIARTMHEELITSASATHAESVVSRGERMMRGESSSTDASSSMTD